MKQSDSTNECQRHARFHSDCPDCVKEREWEQLKPDTSTNKESLMSLRELEQLRDLLKKLIASDGDLPDQRLHKALGFVVETLEDSRP